MATVTREQVAEMIDLLLDGTSESLEFFPYDLFPVQINDGLCEEFACGLIAALGRPDNLVLDCRPGHVFVRLIGDPQLYFDAEMPFGCVNVDALPYFERLK